MPEIMIFFSPRTHLHLIANSYCKWRELTELILEIDTIDLVISGMVELSLQMNKSFYNGLQEERRKKNLRTK